MKLCLAIPQRPFPILKLRFHKYWSRLYLWRFSQVFTILQIFVYLASKCSDDLLGPKGCDFERLDILEDQ